METKKFMYLNTMRFGPIFSMRFGRIFLFLLSLVCFTRGLVDLTKLISLLAGHKTELTLSAGDLFGSFIELSVFVPLIFAFLSYLATDIEVEESGLRIKFVFRSFFVNWNDIEDFKPRNGFNPLALTRAHILVTKNALTPFHRLYGLMYGRTNKPSLLIGPSISNYDALIKTINNNRKSAYKERTT